MAGDGLGMSLGELLMWLAPFLIPLFLVLFSGRSKGSAKAGWSILTLFTSWIGYSVFLIATSKKES